MIRNKVYFDNLLERADELFDFKGKVKFYPTREIVASDAKVFKSVESYKKFLFSKEQEHLNEFIVIMKSKCEIGARLLDEIATFKVVDGEKKLVYYDDLTVDRSKVPIDLDALKRELLGLFDEIQSENTDKKVS